MNTKSQTSNTGFMPRSIAITRLASPQSKTNGFRKRCLRAMERIVEPVSRSTRLKVSAPATPLQRFERKLRKSNAKQLTTWLRRTARRGNRLQDLLFESQTALDSKPTLEMLERGIAEIDAITQAIQSELDNRRCRGIGYAKPIKWSGRLIVS